jgi:hypothetical protein
MLAFERTSDDVGRGERPSRPSPAELAAVDMQFDLIINLRISEPDSD